jgi:methionine-rich copper-binding protein CopC
MRRILSILIIAAGLILAPRAASAHIFLDHAIPGADARLSAPPTVLVLVFDGPVEGETVDIALFDRTGHKLVSNADTGVTVKWATVSIPLPKLEPGAYRVTWAVKLKPGHETSGDYRFTLK